MKRPSYRAAIKWIALNDEPEERAPVTVSEMISVQLTADLFEVSADRVAMDVIVYRNTVPAT
jgi:hypothetical protein